ncbi:LysR family transcriptional regulator [Marinomonas mediterranea]|jgi:transcriptional regulator, LysR family|uniref:Transcriptional regulator, LysR family n=1 Tax=Marinomonas mediterranea (strain ATCC 700492 / JCM 21426 / NBRC 103028 / MMB-1) TaxID=717774 RepID=F2K495_MARM1|nr:LysR family transcriptional regulator [Marinomonas mediterranea]ADZ92536.1 transcriptional regulator, LysR family [Marinomonas mediterranea MMB-1]WCN10482.1 LysR family transcriptional regulator [Marinomonas mediterranea]WCN18581.1 LysR family transcriptional regulator [Marinomonas mediterranea MMB-1]
MHNAITLDNLRVVEAIRQSGSFAGAAQVLHKVPSALTYTVTKLEDDLGLLLFERSKKGARLTAAGTLVLEQGRPILEAVARLEESMRAFEAGWEPCLRIAHDVILSTGPLLQVIGEFLDRELPVEVVYDSVAVGGGWDSLISEQCDIAVGVSGDFPKGEFEVKAIGTFSFLFAIAPTHPLALLDRPVSAQDLREYPSIVVSDSSRVLPKISSGIFESKQTVKVPDMASKIAAQCMGLGVGYLPTHLVQDKLKDGSLVERECEIPRADMTAYIAWRKAKKGKGLRWFVEHLSAADWGLCRD